MNVIYLNKNLQYNEAFPDDSGKIIINEENIIVGFVDRGMLYALKDDENEILTPFEIFVQFNDMSVEFIQPHHFQRAERILNFEGKVFCELKQVFTCTTFLSPVGEFKALFNFDMEQQNKIHTIIHDCYRNLQQGGVWVQEFLQGLTFKIERKEGGSTVLRKTFNIEAGKIPVITAPFHPTLQFVYGATVDYGGIYGERYLQAINPYTPVIYHKRVLSGANQTGATHREFTYLELQENKDKYQVFDLSKIELDPIVKIAFQKIGAQTFDIYFTDSLGDNVSALDTSTSEYHSAIELFIGEFPGEGMLTVRYTMNVDMMPYSYSHSVTIEEWNQRAVIIM